MPARRAAAAPSAAVPPVPVPPAPVPPVPDGPERRPGDATEAVEGPHEWVSFEDAEESRTWVFDVTFLTSRWTCVYGRGCQGVLTRPAADQAEGCCSYGAHFVDADDYANVVAATSRLTRQVWQFADVGRRRGFAKKLPNGHAATRLVDGACIFLNRPGFGTGPGCALHHGAVAAGARPMDWKPNVCWQLPLRRDDSDDGHGHVTSTIREWKRRDWGAGGNDFHWWCTEASEAFTGGAPVWRTLRDELIGIVGEAVYGQLAAYLAARERRVFLPHPAVRR